jgi:septal ring factor EnvC (AmiA/AmiB activator)
MIGRKSTAWLWAAVAAISGCGNWTYNPPATTAHPPVTAAPAPAGDAAYLGKASAVKSEGGADVASAVETALALSDKQVKLTDELLQAQQAKRDLEEVNRKLAGQSAKLQTDLDAAQKELAEANQMLVEMKKELEAWKGNVLGFRDEIRKAQKAELDSLRKILVVLGADAPVTASAASQPSSQPSELQARAGL